MNYICTNLRPNHASSMPEIMRFIVCFYAELSNPLSRNSHLARSKKAKWVSTSRSFRNTPGSAPDSYMLMILQTPLLSCP